MTGLLLGRCSGTHLWKDLTRRRIEKTSWTLTYDPETTESTSDRAWTRKSPNFAQVDEHEIIFVQSCFHVLEGKSNFIAPPPLPLQLYLSCIKCGAFSGLRNSPKCVPFCLICTVQSVFLYFSYLDQLILKIVLKGPHTYIRTYVPTEPRYLLFYLCCLPACLPATSRWWQGTNASFLCLRR